MASVVKVTASPVSIALWFKSIGHEAWFDYYLMAVIFVSLIVYATMHDTKHHSAFGRHSRGTKSIRRRARKSSVIPALVAMLDPMV
jgi:hypothetical protein